VISAQAGRLREIRHVALDMDGTIYRGATLFDFTPAFLSRLRELGIGYTFLTNNSSRSVKDYLKKLHGMGIEADESCMFTSTLSTLDYLADVMPAVRRLFVLGTPSLREEFTAHGHDVIEDDAEPEGVIVGFDTGLNYERLCRAAWWISRGKPFIATHPDLICPTDLPTVLVDCGAVCRCLEAATGRPPDAVLGKPDARMLTGILRRHGLKPRELAMAGDRVYTDVAMARRAGAYGVLVLTGEATAEDAASCDPPPDLVVPSLAHFGEMLEQVRAEA
jgi:HAD superfamily hydrolase (TIGR01450 family)